MAVSNAQKSTIITETGERFLHKQINGIVDIAINILSLVPVKNIAATTISNRIIFTNVACSKVDHDSYARRKTNMGDATK
jgi:hypothetical protein